MSLYRLRTAARVSGVLCIVVPYILCCVPGQSTISEYGMLLFLEYINRRAQPKIDQLVLLTNDTNSVL